MIYLKKEKYLLLSANYLVMSSTFQEGKIPSLLTLKILNPSGSTVL